MATVTTGIGNEQKIRIIDLTIPLPERMEDKNVIVGKSIRWTCDYLGIHKNVLYRCLGKKVYSEKLDKWMALRIEK